MKRESPIRLTPLLLAAIMAACDATPTDTPVESAVTPVSAYRGNPGPPPGVGPPEDKGPPPGRGPAFLSRIAFSSDRDGAPEIHVMDADGSNTVRLTFKLGGSDPMWSPDGTRIAFATGTGLWLMNPDGSELAQLGPSVGSCRYEEPAWSPDGTKVAFAIRCFDASAIFITDIADDFVPPLLTLGTRDTDPAWSPDGSRIAFTSGERGHGEIWVMNADGSGETFLGPVDPACSAADPDAREPAWSPDGVSIVFSFRCHEHWDIYRMDADGSGLVRLTDSVVEDFEPAWSSDGRWIAFASGHPFRSSNIHVMNADGSSPMNLTEGVGGRNFSPSWEP